MNPRETVDFWLDYAPKMWNKAMFPILIEELEHGLPLYLTASERNARLQALYQLTKKSNAIQQKKRR